MQQAMHAAPWAAAGVWSSSGGRGGNNSTIAAAESTCFVVIHNITGPSTCRTRRRQVVASDHDVVLAQVIKQVAAVDIQVDDIA